MFLVTRTFKVRGAVVLRSKATILLNKHILVAPRF